jgi:hypothetical protein
MAPVKPTSLMLEGKQVLTLVEARGRFSCDRHAGDPIADYHVILVRGGKPLRSLLRLEGPAATVAGWREEFLELLKTVGP